MSYALHIWEKPDDQPWPATVDEAAGLLRRLRRVERGQNPKFVLLAQRLTGRYPCITSPEADDIPESELAWSDGPLDGKTQRSAYGVGVRVELLDEVRPFVIEQANALGLNVSDDQAGEVYLANGTTLRLHSPSQPTPGPAAAQERVPGAREIEALVVERLTPLMAKHGFAALRGKGAYPEYKRAFAGGWHIVTVFVGEESALYRGLSVSARSRFHVVQDLIATILTPEKAEKDVASRHTTMLSQRKWLDDPGVYGGGSTKEYEIRSLSQLHDLLEHLSAKLEERFFPVLEEYETLEGLDALLNPPDVSSSVFFDRAEGAFSNVIAAFLARNPRLEALCTELESKARDPRYNRDVLRCIEYVRSRRDRTVP